MAQTPFCAHNIFVPTFASIALLLFPEIAESQSVPPSVDCHKVTVFGSVSTKAEDGAIDWLALANQAELGPVELDSSEGCLMDTEGVGVDEIVVSAEEGAAISELVEGEIKVHQRGSNFSSEQNSESQLIPSNDKKVEENNGFTLKDLPPYLQVLSALIPISVLLVVLRYALFGIGGGRKQDTRRFGCKIPANIAVNGQCISGRVIRFGPATCHFVPSTEADANWLAGLLMNADVPDFDLQVGMMTLPIIPDTPGSRFTVAFFVEPLSADQLDSLKELSLSPIRVEKQSQAPKKSAHRENLRASRLRRMQALAS